MTATGHHAWVEDARRRNERWIHGFLAVIGLVASANLAISAAHPEHDPAAAPLAALLGAWGALYAALARRGLPPASAHAWRWGTTALEVSLPLLVMAVDAQVSTRQALLDAPAALWVVMILLSVLRLTPSLPMGAGLLAAAEWLGMYLWLTRGERFDEPYLQLGAALRRTGVLVVAGVLASRVSAVLLDLVARVEEQTVERERVRRAFGAYVATQVVERVLSGDLRVRSERRHITVLFVDIRGFTAFAEARPAQEVVDRLNVALDRFAGRVQACGGLVNKFLGDGLLALFGAPDADPEHAVHAVEAALAIRAEAAALARAGAWEGLKLGLGLHTGEVVVGDIGGERQREYTAIGDTVNVASRVEGLTKDFGVELLLTSAVAEALGGRWPLRSVGRAPVRGRAGEVELSTIDQPA